MSKMLKPTILSLSLLTIISTSAVSPALGEISDYFSSADRFLIQLVAVLHALAIVPSLFFASWLTSRFTKKKVLLVGLAVFSLAGMGAVFANSIFSLLVFRVFLGIGLGLVIPFSTALISDYFDGEEKERMMGLSSSFNMLGAMVALTCSGYLAMVSWRLPFLIYGVGIPVLILNLVYLPDVIQDQGGEGTVTGDVPARVYPVAGLMFLFCMIFFILTPTMALFLRDNSLGDSSMAGIAISFSTIGGFFSGFLLTRTRKWTGKLFFPSMLAMMSMGFWFLYLSSVLGMVFLGSAVIGFANRSIFPIFFLHATRDISREQSVKVTAMLSSMIYVGQFTAPIFQKMVGFVFHDTTARFLYLFVALLTTVTAVALVTHYIFKRQRELQYSSKEI
ncbi:MAG: MFS transporter [Synergistales bacterium]|nr:MFS transporter [Synergistales bacterium]